MNITTQIKSPTAHCRWSILVLALSAASYGQVAPSPNSPDSASPPDTSANQTVLLPQYKVSDTKANQYNAEDAASVARIASSILDSPMTVNVISPALIEDLGTTAIDDDVTYFAGMS